MKSVLRGRMASLTLALVVSAAGVLADDGGSQNNRAKEFESGGPTVNAHDPNRLTPRPPRAEPGPCPRSSTTAAP